MSQYFIPTVQAGTKIYVYTRRPEPGPFYSTADYPDTPGAGTEGEEAGIFLSAKRYDDVNEY
jgi:hypothetical protein